MVPNLMIGFGIDEIQAEYVAEIKLRHLNREYILKRTNEIDKLEKDIADMEDILKSKARVKSIIIGELREVSQKFGQPRRSSLIYASEIEEAEELVEEIPDYPCTFFFTEEGYFKKITPQSLRMSGEQKLKEGDTIIQTVEASNNRDLLFFTDRAAVYKAKASEFGDTKASVLGDYVAGKLGFEEGERALYMAVTADYSGYMLFFFENGKAAKVEMSAYATKTNRRRLVGAFSDKAPTVAIRQVPEDGEFMLTSTAGRMLLVHTGAIAAKTTRLHHRGAGDDPEGQPSRQNGRTVRGGDGGEARPLPQKHPRRRRDARRGGYRGTADPGIIVKTARSLLRAVLPEKRKTAAGRSVTRSIAVPAADTANAIFMSCICCRQ